MRTTLSLTSCVTTGTSPRSSNFTCPINSSAVIEPPLAASPPEGGAPFVARRAVNLHGCAPASRAPFPQIPAFEARCIRPGIVPLPHRTALVRLGRAPRRRRRIDPLGARPLRERNPESRPHCAPCSPYGGGTPVARSSCWGAPPPAATPSAPPVVS